jgi:phosphotransferase system  glucose/maltose/N-acetylglucosamine-specific IIC component
MNDLEKILLIVLAIIVAVGIFLGFTTAIKKSFIAGEKQTKDPSAMITEQRRRSQETRNQQKRLLESQKQRVRDARR